MIMNGAMRYNGLKDCIESEGKSCSFEPELRTPLMVHDL